MEPGPAITLIRGIGRLVTLSEVGVITNGAVVTSGGQIAWAGRFQDLPDGWAKRIDGECDIGGAMMTPGFIDAHTHPVYAVPRLDEIARRAAGASYLDIAREGGGIGATIRTTRAMAGAELELVVADRIRAWLTAGTTTAEVKTGYHLDHDGEIGAVGMLASLDAAPDMPSLVVTLLAAHAVPSGGITRSEYADLAASWSPDASRAGARFCDVFCDEGYFTVEEAATILLAGRAAGLGLRIHADELARTGGAMLASELEASSADHLLRCTAEDAVAMARAGVVATLCPVTAMTMGRTPPVRSLIDAGARIALGSDHNPGTSGVGSMALVVALAIAGMGMSVDEALRAATLGGAASLGLSDRGSVTAGWRADLVAWDTDHEGAFAWDWGLSPRSIWLEGRIVRVPSPSHQGILHGPSPSTCR